MARSAGSWAMPHSYPPPRSACRHEAWLIHFGNVPVGTTLADELAPLAEPMRRLRIIGGIGIVLGYSFDDPAIGERLQVCLQRVRNLLGIDFPVVHVEHEGFQIFFLLRRILDRRLRPLIERITFDAVLFCRGDILRKGVELAFRRSAMIGEDIEQRRQCRITKLSAYRFRRGKIVDIESNLILPLRSHANFDLLVAPDLPFPIARRYRSAVRSPTPTLLLAPKPDIAAFIAKVG